MPDITMCTNTTCERRQSCYRFTAEPSVRQSYAEFQCNPEKPYTEMYWPNLVDSPSSLEVEGGEVGLSTKESEEA